jgi:hypothetical protein
VGPSMSVSETVFVFMERETRWQGGSLGPRRRCLPE